MPAASAKPIKQNHLICYENSILQRICKGFVLLFFGTLESGVKSRACKLWQSPHRRYHHHELDARRYTGTDTARW